MVLEAYLQQYGILFLFAVCVLEGAMVLYFAPSEALVPVSIAVLGADAFTVAAVLFSSVAGSTLGQLTLFLGLRSYGREWLDTSWIPFAQDRHIERSSKHFESYGGFAVAVTNMLPFVRGTMTFPAGLTSYSVLKFAVASLIGSLVFQAALAAVAVNASSLF